VLILFGSNKRNAVDILRSVAQEALSRNEKFIELESKLSRLRRKYSRQLSFNNNGNLLGTKKSKGMEQTLKQIQRLSRKRDNLQDWIISQSLQIIKDCHTS
jgi:Zn-dependent oligopeptidase